MLTQSLNTSISSTKVAPVPFAKPDPVLRADGACRPCGVGIFLPQGRGDLR